MKVENENTKTIPNWHASDFSETMYYFFVCIYRLLGENAKMEIIRKAGHAINAEKWKVFYKHLKSFVTDHPKLESNGNNRKAD